MHPPDLSFPSRFLRWLAGALASHPRRFFYPQAFLILACLLYTVARLEFSTSRNDLVGAEKRYHQNFLRYKEEFSVRDDLVAVIESEDAEKNRQFVERLGAKLQSETNLFTDVFYKGDLKKMGPKALLFLSNGALDELSETLRQYRPFIEDFAQATNLAALFGKINERFRTADENNDSENESLVKAIPSITRLVRQATGSVTRPGVPPSPGIASLLNSGDRAGNEQYVTFGEGSIYLVSAVVAKDRSSGDAVERLRVLVRETRTEVPGVNVGITGETVLEYDEMAQARRDSMSASVAALILVALIFVLGYREFGRPFGATACLLVGLTYTLGYTTLVVGHLNILTVTFLPILIGLAIDFGIHLITRYEEELKNGESQQVAIEKALVNTGLGVFTGCFTTSGAFFAMALTDFKGIQEMGIITGGGMLICLIPMITLLPILLLSENRRGAARPQKRPQRGGGFERLWLARPATVLSIGGVLLTLSVTQIPKVRFDYNLLNMQSKGLPAVTFENKLIGTASKSVLYAAIVADSAEESIRMEKKLADLPSVATIDSMGKFLAEDQSAKLSKVSRIKRELGSIDFRPLDSGLPNLPELSRTLFYTWGYLGLAAKRVPSDQRETVARDLEVLRESIGEFRNHLVNSDPRQASYKIKEFQVALFDDIRKTFEALKNQDESGTLEISDLPAFLRNRFVGRSGKHLLQVYPNENVWERRNQEKFVSELRTIDPDATGTPVQLLEYTSLLKSSYIEAAWYALTAVAILVFIHFGTLSSVGLGLLPVAAGTLCATGIMGWLNIPFNPANIMTLPLVIGIGVTNGIHILNRVVEERSPSILGKSTGKAVLISGLTTIAGFASLIPAKHQGISSLGTVMALGVGSCMLAGITLLPTVLSLCMVQKLGYKKPSGDNARSTLGREEPR